MSPFQKCTLKIDKILIATKEEILIQGSLDKTPIGYSLTNLSNLFFDVIQIGNERSKEKISDEIYRCGLIVDCEILRMSGHDKMEIRIIN